MGNSAARNLTLVYDSWPEELDDVATKTKRMFETPRTLPPRASLRVYWRLQAKGGFTDGSTEVGMPRTGTITASYTSDDPSHPAYTDSYEVLIDASGFMPVPEDGWSLRDEGQPAEVLLGRNERSPGTRGVAALDLATARIGASLSELSRGAASTAPCVRTSWSWQVASRVFATGGVHEGQVFVRADSLTARFQGRGGGSAAGAPRGHKSARHGGTGHSASS